MRDNSVKREKTKNTPDYIHQFIVKKVRGQNKRVAVFVGKILKDGFVHIGWSKTNAAAGDTFNREFGINIALERTKAELCVPVPQSIYGDALDFIDRCSAYFKDAHGVFKISKQPSTPKCLEKVREIKPDLS